MMRRIPIWIILTGLVLAVFITFDLYPGLRGGAGWQWPYLWPQNIGAVIALAVGLAIYVAVSALLMRYRRTRSVVAWAVMGGTAIAYLVTGIQGDIGFTLFSRTVSPVQTGASTLATQVMQPEGTLATLQRWPEVMRESLDANIIHFTTSPPGQVLFHQWAAEIFDNPALDGIIRPLSRNLRAYQCTAVEVMRSSQGQIVSAGLGILFPLFAALAAIPLYFIVCDLTGDKHTAARIALWVGLIPGLSMFAPTWNTIYPFLCLVAFWLLLRGLMFYDWRWIFGAGVVMSLTTFLNFSVLPMLLLMGIFTLMKTLWVTDGRRPAGWRALIWPVRAGVIFGAGLLSIWLVFALMTGVSPLAILRETFTAHTDLVVREYAPWLVLHAWDVILFTGLPVALLAIWGAVSVVRGGVRDPLAAFTLSMALTFILVDFAGIVQGENARILIFYMPFLLLMGGSTRSSFTLRWETGLMATQTVVLLAMAAVLPVVPLDMNPQAFAPRTDIGGLEGVPWQPSGVTLTPEDGAFRLKEYRHVGDPSVQAITFEFAWEGISPTERPYQMVMVASTQDPEVGFLQSEPLVWTPQGGAYPPTCWGAGQIINDVVVLRVPAVSAPVVWEVSVYLSDGLSDSAQTITLAPVKYP